MRVCDPHTLKSNENDLCDPHTQSQTERSGYAVQWEKNPNVICDHASVTPTMKRTDAGQRDEN